MKLSLIKTLWAAIKGVFTPGTSAEMNVVDYILDSVYTWYSDIDGVMKNIKAAYSGLVTVCDKLDYYAKYVPAPWTDYYKAIRDMLYAARDTLADSRVERSEVERVVSCVRNAIEAWRK